MTLRETVSGSSWLQKARPRQNAAKKGWREMQHRKHVANESITKSGRGLNLGREERYARTVLGQLHIQYSLARESR